MKNKPQISIAKILKKTNKKVRFLPGTLTKIETCTERYEYLMWGLESTQYAISNGISLDDAFSPDNKTVIFRLGNRKQYRDLLKIGAKVISEEEIEQKQSETGIQYESA